MLLVDGLPHVGGHPEEAAALMIYLLSGWAGFITGQMIPLTGGDWL